MSAMGVLLVGTVASAAQPNFVVIMTDDMPVSMLSAMPFTKSLIGAEGSSYEKAYVEVPLCCPSRSTFLTGMYAHNHMVRTNENTMGAYKTFRDRGLENQTIAVWLKNAGYRTALIGKYLNGYVGADVAHIPPGWTRWFAAVGNFRNGFNWSASDQGVYRAYGTGDSNFTTDVLLSKATEFIAQSATGTQPFFLFFSVSAPHEPAPSPSRHAGLFTTSIVPRTPAFNEADMSDKPSFLAQYPVLSATDTALRDIHYGDGLRSLQSVDEAVKTIYTQLQTLGKLENTYLIFTSDHGSHFGEHRAPEGKQLPYEEDVQVPLLIRGPNVRANHINSQDLIVNVDLAPTILELAGIPIPSSVDGTSAKPLIDMGTSLTQPWRKAFPLARWRGPTDNLAPYPHFTGVHTGQYTWVEWANGEKELYDLAVDPYQINNVASSTQYAATRAQLSTLGAALGTCVGAACRTLERQGMATTSTSTLKNGLLGHWTMDTANIHLSQVTAEIRDISGAGRHGNWLNHASTTVAGKINQAILLDGVNDAVSVGTGINLANKSFSVSGWIRQSASGVGDGTNEHLILQSASSTAVNNKVLHMGIRGVGAQAGKITFAFWNNDLNSVAAIYDTANWYHIVGTYNAATNERKLYIDGVLNNSDVASADYQGTGLLCLSRCAGQPAAGGAELSGAIDDVRIYNRVLSPTEVAELYALGTQ